MKTTIDYEALSQALFERACAESGLSQRELSKRMGVTPGTIKNWLSGYSFPNMPDLLRLFSQIDVAPLRAFLDMIYPDDYKKMSRKSSVDDLRKSLKTYYTNVAPDSEIRLDAFNKFGRHGSSCTSQSNLAAAYNHLPMEDRTAVAKLIMHFYSLRKRQGALVCSGNVKPDTETIIRAIDAAMGAVIEGKTTYTAIKEDVSDSDTD